MTGMTVGRNPVDLARNAGPFLGAIATSVLVGLIVAVAMASRAPAPDMEKAAAPAPKPCAEVGITPGTNKGGTCQAKTGLLTVAIGNQPLVLPDRRVKVISTQFVEATTYEGQLRQRARLEVRLRIENTTSKPIVANADGGALRLRVAGQTVQADPNADELGGVLRRQRPIAALQATEGTLRFETAGAATAALRNSKRADLGVAGAEADRKGIIRLRIP